MTKKKLLELLKDKEVREVIKGILDTKKTEITTTEILEDLKRSRSWLSKSREINTVCKLTFNRKSGRQNVYTYKSYKLWKKELMDKELL